MDDKKILFENRCPFVRIVKWMEFGSVWFLLERSRLAIKVLHSLTLPGKPFIIVKWEINDKNIVICGMPLELQGVNCVEDRWGDRDRCGKYREVIKNNFCTA